MGLAITVARSGAPLATLIEALGHGGMKASVLMIDGALVAPGASPALWREARLRTPAGMVTLLCRDGAITISVFGNADANLVAAQERIAEALRAG